MEWCVPKLISLNGATGYGRACTTGQAAKATCEAGGFVDGTADCNPGPKDVGYILCGSGSAAKDACDSGTMIG